MSEEFSLKITLEGIDDATDEIKSVSEALKQSGEINDEIVARAKEVIKEQREQKMVLRALAEENKVFSDTAEFMVGKLNDIASFAGRVNNIFNSLNTAMTRLNTAHLRLAEAQERQAEAQRKLEEATKGVSEKIQELNEQLAKAEEELAAARRRQAEAQEKYNQILQAGVEGSQAYAEMLDKLRKAQAAEAEAQMELENAYLRLSTLVNEGITSGKEYEKALKAVKDAEEDLARAREKVAEIQKTIMKGATKEQEAALKELMKAQEEVAKQEEKIAQIRKQIASVSAKEQAAAQKELEEANRKLAEAQREVEQATLQANLQFISLGVQSVGLVPSFMKMVDSVKILSSTFPALVGGFGQLSTGLTAVKTAFTGLYAAMGPVGLILIALSVIIPLIITYWEDIKAALEAVGAAIWSVVGPALQWIWENILKPLAEFLLNYFISTWKSIHSVLEFFVANVLTPLGNALKWIWDNILVPLATFLALQFKANIEIWVKAFQWAQETISKIFNAIKNVIEGVLNWIKEKIDWVVNSIKGAFDYLWKTLVGGSIIPDMWTDIRDWTRWGVEEMNKLMSDVNMGFTGPRVVGGVSVVVNVNQPGATAEEIAEKVSREIVLRLRGMGV